jgi:hypothetical protein
MLDRAGIIATDLAAAVLAQSARSPSTTAHLSADAALAGSQRSANQPWGLWPISPTARR